MHFNHCLVFIALMLSTVTAFDLDRIYSKNNDPEKPTLPNAFVAEGLIRGLDIDVDFIACQDFENFQQAAFWSIAYADEEVSVQHWTCKDEKSFQAFYNEIQDDEKCEINEFDSSEDCKEVGLAASLFVVPEEAEYLGTNPCAPTHAPETECDIWQLPGKDFYWQYTVEGRPFMIGEIEGVAILPRTWYPGTDAVEDDLFLLPDVCYE